MSEPTIARCDYCMASDPEPVYVVESVPFAVGDIISTGELAACSECHADLSAARFDDIFRRWWSNTNQPTGAEPHREEFREALLGLWGTSWTNRRGVREATQADRAIMVAELARYRRARPERTVD